MKNYLAKFSLKGKTAFVVGGAGLIGAESAVALASAGAKVVILDVDEKKARKVLKEIKKNRGRADFHQFDMTQIDESKDKIESLLEYYRAKALVWVNAAYPRTADWANALENINSYSLKKNVEMQLVSCLWINRIVGLYMKRKKIRGSIINLGSVYGVVGNDMTIYEGTRIMPFMAYPAIKGGIVNATRYFASYFGKYDIRFNCLCPGGVFDGQDPVFVRNYNRKVPLKRMATVDEIACAVLFLASDASSYITGTAFMVDGGWTCI